MALFYFISFQATWPLFSLYFSESQRSRQGTDLMHSSIGKGQYPLLRCLADMVDQLPAPSQGCILLEISFVAMLVGYEEKLRFGQVDFKSSDRTKSAVL